MTMNHSLKRNSKVGGEGSGTTEQYRICKVISFSEFSIVYVALNETDGTKCIVKEFSPNRYVYRDKDGLTLRRIENSSDDKYEALWNTFQNEGELLEKCKHKGVVRCLDRFEQNDTAYIVMEYCEGVTLDKYIAKRKSKLTPKFLYKSIIPFIGTLAYIHKIGVIHRDLKPNNIMIDENGRCTLIDFGSAISWNETRQPYMNYTTAGYSPIEFYSEQTPQGPVSDIYSFAAVLYFCYLGVAPTDVRKRLFDDQLESLGTGKKQSWPFLSRVLHRGMIVPPEKRCSSLGWFKTAITLEYVMSPILLNHGKNK